jgi:pimeloyl-ACP methyl ester carboxylesterase
VSDELKHIELGSGPVVILLHGMAASSYDWAALMPALASLGYRALAVDLLGHGDSPKPDDPRAYTLENCYQSLETWISDLALQPPLILIGHSLGGYLCLEFALRHAQQVAALALVDPLYKLGQISPLLRLFRGRADLGAKAMEAVPLELIDRLLAWDSTNLAGFSPQARRQIALDYKRASPNILLFSQHIQDLTPRLGQIHCPTLVLWGERDLTLRPASFPALVARLPNATGHSLPRSGHQPHIGQPIRVNRLILDFLVEHTAES